MKQRQSPRSKLITLTAAVLGASVGLSACSPGVRATPPTGAPPVSASQGAASPAQEDDVSPILSSDMSGNPLPESPLSDYGSNHTDGPPGPMEGNRREQYPEIAEDDVALCGVTRGMTQSKVKDTLGPPAQVKQGIWIFIMEGCEIHVAFNGNSPDEVSHITMGHGHTARELRVGDRKDRLVDLYGPPTYQFTAHQAASEIAGDEEADWYDDMYVYVSDPLDAALHFWFKGSALVQVAVYPTASD